MSTANQLLFSIAMDVHREELDATKKRLEAFELCHDKVTAAALGYLLAKEEAKKEAEDEFEIYTRICTIIDSCIDCDGSYYTESAAEAIFEAIYEWLTHYTDKGYEAELAKLFKPYIVQK
jgi:hypothetical protein